VIKTCSHFNNLMALSNLGNAYFAVGNNPETYLVIQMLAANNVALPFAFHADHITFDILVDFIRKADTNNKKTALTLHTLQDLCLFSENIDSTVMHCFVEVLVDAFMQMSNDLKTVGAARACENAFEALRFLLYSCRVQMTFSFHGQGIHAMREFVGTCLRPLPMPLCCVYPRSSIPSH
jgi:hypothetical protein